MLSPNSHCRSSTRRHRQAQRLQPAGRASAEPGLVWHAGTIDLGFPPGTVLTVGKQGVFELDDLFSGTRSRHGDLVKTGLASSSSAAAVLRRHDDGAAGSSGSSRTRPGQRHRRARPQRRRRDAPGRRELRRPRRRDSSAPTRSLTASPGRRRSPPAGTRTIGHQLSGTTHNGCTVTFSGPIALEKDLQLYCNGRQRQRGSRLQAQRSGQRQRRAGEDRRRHDDARPPTTPTPARPRSSRARLHHRRTEPAGRRGAIEQWVRRPAPTGAISAPSFNPDSPATAAPRRTRHPRFLAQPPTASATWT